MAVAPPPVIDAFTTAFRRSGTGYLVMGAMIFLIGISTIVFGLVGDAGAANATNILKFGGGLLGSSSLVPFKMGYNRFERIGYLALLQARWAQVAQVGDPGNEIPELKKMYLKLIRDSLGRTA